MELHNFVWLVKEWDKDAGRPRPCGFWGVKQCNGFVKQEIDTGINSITLSFPKNCFPMFNPPLNDMINQIFDGHTMLR